MTRIEDLKECNEYIKGLYETESAGKNLFVISKYKRKPVYGQIVSIKPRKSKGVTVYDVLVQLAEKRTERSYMTSPVTMVVHDRIYTLAPPQVVRLRNITRFEVVNERSTYQFSHD